MSGKGQGNLVELPISHIFSLKKDRNLRKKIVSMFCIVIILVIKEYFRVSSIGMSLFVAFHSIRLLIIQFPIICTSKSSKLAREHGSWFWEISGEVDLRNPFSIFWRELYWHISCYQRFVQYNYGKHGYIQGVLHTGCSTYRVFYIQGVLHTGCSTYRVFYIQGVLHTGCSTYRVFYIQGVLHTGCSTYRVFYIQGVLHTGCSTYRVFYIQGVLHTGCSTYRVFYIQAVLHTGCSTYRVFYIHTGCSTYRVFYH